MTTNPISSLELANLGAEEPTAAVASGKIGEANPTPPLSNVASASPPIPDSGLEASQITTISDSKTNELHNSEGSGAGSTDDATERGSTTPANELEVPADPDLSTKQADISIEDESSRLPDEENGVKKEPRSEIDPASFPEGGLRAWSVVFCSFWIQFVVVGFRDSFGVYQRYFNYNSVFPGSSNAAVSFIGTLGACGLSLFGPTAGMISDSWGYQRTTILGGALIMIGFILGSFGNELWQMFCSLSLFFMFGFPAAYYPAVAAPGQYFLRRRGIAFGLSIAGSGLGGFAFSNLSQKMIDTIGWRWALRATGLAGGTVIIVAGIFLKPRLARLPRGKPFNWRYFKDKDFLRLFALQFCASFGFYVPTYFVPAFATNIGQGQVGSLVLSVQNICSAFGRLALPLLSELRWTGPMNIFVVSMLTLGLAPMAILATSTTAGQMFAFAVIWGVSSGGLTSVNTIVIANVLGTNSLSEKIGHVFLSFLAGQLAGPAIAGAMIDATTVYNPDGTRTSNFTGALLFAGLMICPIGWSFLVWLRMEKAGWKVLRRV